MKNIDITSHIPPISFTHLISGKEINAIEMLALIQFALLIKNNKFMCTSLLANKTVSLLFEKPSLRTRFSFISGIQFAGGHVIESVMNNTHANKEQPRDMIRVLQGYCDALVVRTFQESFLEELSFFSNIPIINGLSDNYHPCQILSDFLTIFEHFQMLSGLTLCYVGDGNNILNTFIVMAPLLGLKVHYACPKDSGPLQSLLSPDNMTNNTPQHNASNNINAFQTPQDAVKGAHIVYTDVWTSMGAVKKDEYIFKPFQVNEELMSYADKDAIFLHCLPMLRGKEVSETLPEQKCSLIFNQSHNRMYMQLALLVALLRSPSSEIIPTKNKNTQTSKK